MNGSTPVRAGAVASPTEVLATTIAAAVERQLTQYISVMVHQVESARLAVEQNKIDLRIEFREQIEAIERRILNELENRIVEMPAVLGIGTSVDPVEIANLRDQIDNQSAAAHARIDELQKASRRFEEEASALVQHVNDTTVALAQRMDEGNQAMASAVEERLGFVRTTLEGVAPEVQRQLTEQATHVAQRLDFTEHKITDRMLAMEDRVNEQSGVKIANLEATIGRIGSGFDDAIGAMSHRLLGIENQVGESLERLDALKEQVDKVDEKAINEVKEQLSAAIGESMLVRIEIDRLSATTDERLDKANLRLGEIEGQLADEMDLSAAVQLERLEELERAIVAFDPDQFVRKSDPGADPGDARTRPTLAGSEASTSTMDLPFLPDTSGSAYNTPSPSLSSF